MADWPLTLPALPLHDSYNNSTQSGVVRDSGYAGKVNVRRRFTAVTKTHNVSLVLTRTEYLVFLDFFNLTIADGVLPFNYTNPIFQLGTIRARFKEGSYSVSFDDDTLDYSISFVLEELPGSVIIPSFPERKVTSEAEQKITTNNEDKVTSA